MSHASIAPRPGAAPLADWMAEIQATTESALAATLPESQQVPQRLHAAMRYATLSGGKRVRPLLCHAAGECTQAAADKLRVVACSVELIHAYSLVHDDLPCMDDDVLRRGRPTCHVQYDEATALLVGDSLQTLAFAVLARQPIAAPAQQLEMLALLAEASGSLGMAGGQAIDLESVGQKLDIPTLELMHRQKTGALIRASILLGALCGTLHSPQRQALETFAQHLGLLFQVVDDILDCTASTDSLGKTAGKDAAANKPTFVSILGLAAARAYADTLRSDALHSLQPLGEGAHRLAELTHFIATRHN